MNSIEVIGLNYTYPGGAHALQGVSFAVQPGESVGIVGANGAGKSTLLRHLNGSLEPQAGSVRIADFLVAKKTLPDVRRIIGTVLQDADDQLFMPTVYQDVAFGPMNLGLPIEEVDARVVQALERVGAAHLSKRPPYRLSGGEKRSVAIATVLAMNPEVLVLDEPTSNLDPRARRELIELLTTFGHTKIIAGHDLDMIADVCERTMIIHEGKIVADGPTLAIFNDAALLQRSHLERPLRMQVCPVCRNKH